MTSVLTSDRNLLFGVIAVQTDLLDGQRFAQACASWAMSREGTLGDVLLARGWITQADHDDIEKLLVKLLERRTGSQSSESLQTVVSIGGDAEQLSAVKVGSRDTDRNYDGFAATMAPIFEKRSRYQLERMVAEGGLGRIWTARDGDLNRLVALKELKPKQSLDRNAWKLFVKEAQITGQLEHPNIVPVYELGRRPDDDQPYYTMKFVHGITLRIAISEHYRRTRESAVYDPLELPRLLNAFVNVCNAISYAHSRGVAHRDLKPENVVLGSYGEVIVLDWGLAKIVGETTEHDTVAVTEDARVDETMAGGVKGTPAYMAPEQASGSVSAIDWRTDIYGLGTILFEILTGQPPHQGNNVHEMLQRIIAGPTPRIRSRNPSAPPALDAVCLKAMELAPERRYDSALELGKEVQRWLADEPVLAYSEPISVRVQRWSRRHKSWVAGIGALMMTAVVASTIAAYLIRGEQRQTAAARDRAESNFQSAMKAVDRLLLKVGSERLKNVPQMDGVRKRIIDDAINFYEAFAKDRPTEAGLQNETGKASRTVAELCKLLGKEDDAKKNYEQSIHWFTELSSRFPDNLDYRRELAESEDVYGEFLRATGKSAEAASHFQAALRIQEQLVKLNPGEPSFHLDFAKTLYNSGILDNDSGRVKEAEAAYQRAVGELEPLVATAPDARHPLARCRINQGKLLADAKPKEAEAAYRSAIALLKEVVKDDPDETEYRFELAVCHTNLGNLLVLGDVAGRKNAESEYREALPLLDRLAADFPAIPQYRTALANCHNSLAAAAYFFNQYSVAEEHWMKAVESFRRLVNEHSGNIETQHRLGNALGNLAQMRMRQERGEEAKPLIAEAIRLQEGVLAAHPENPDYREPLWRNYRVQARIAIKVKDHALAAAACEKQAPYLERQKDFEAAVAIMAQAVDLAETDAALNESQRQLAIQRYGKLAIQLLRSAVAAGLGDPKVLKQAPELEPLRTRPDFQNIIRELEQKPKAPDAKQ